MSTTEPTPEAPAEAPEMPAEAPVSAPVDPDAVEVVAPAVADDASLEPVASFHEETGTTLLTYTGTFDADQVLRLTRRAGHFVVGLPDELDDHTWRVQVATPITPEA